MGSKEELRTGSEVGVAVGGSELKIYDDDTMMPILIYVTVGALWTSVVFHIATLSTKVSDSQISMSTYGPRSNKFS